MIWFLGILGLLIAGFVFQLGLLVYSMYVMFGVLILGRWLARHWISNLEVVRDCNCHAAEVGDVAAVVLTVRNMGILPVAWLIVEDSIIQSAVVERPRRLKISGPRLAVTALKRKEEKVLLYQVQFLARGYYPMGPTLLETGDLFGLHRRFRIAGKADCVLVYPKVVPLLNVNITTRRPMGEVRMTHRLFEDPTRISGVRLYQRGDPLSRVHWQATARTGKLHSKIFEPSCITGATVLLDFHEGRFQGSFGRRIAELAVTTAASISNAVWEQGQQIGLISNGLDAAEQIRRNGWSGDFLMRKFKSAGKKKDDRKPFEPVVVETRKGADQNELILKALARLELSDGLSFEQLVIETSYLLPRNAAVVAVLAGVSEGVAISLGSLKRRGYSVSAVVVMDSVDSYSDWAKPPDWAGHLLAQGVPFKMVDSAEALAEVGASELVRT
ncbi:DUF58 domain-containing protein [Verrucomicrobia bacterium]|nr:DUF58 domain-containing protein [Verrucomicrobiota bacterium]